MNAAALRIETPAAEAEAIASICAHELASPRCPKVPAAT
jgi:hypothetical protein